MKKDFGDHDQQRMGSAGIGYQSAESAAPKHTPGQWEWANDEVFALETNDSICVVLQKLPHADANAALIAAAPDMLEALYLLEHAFASAGNPGCDILAGPFADYALQMIRAAIARVEGRTS